MCQPRRVVNVAGVRGESVRDRLLEAAGLVLADSGPRSLHLSAVAAEAGVSRPTLYAYFPTKQALLSALASYEKARFNQGLERALAGLTGVERLERAFTFMIEFQRAYPMRKLVLIEPEFMLEQLERSLVSMGTSLVPLFEEALEVDAATAADLADLAVRTAISHFLIPRDAEQLVRELRHLTDLARVTGGRR
jgi:AcrR family transcriptional regulator